MIPDSFLPLLQPGDPTALTIFKSAPGLDGGRNPRAPPGGEVYITAIINAELTIGNAITLTGFIQMKLSGTGKEVGTGIILHDKKTLAVDSQICRTAGIFK